MSTIQNTITNGVCQASYNNTDPSTTAPQNKKKNDGGNVRVDTGNVGDTFGRYGRRS